jgi:fluoride exporter
MNLSTVESGMPWGHWLLVAGGGALGAVARVGVALWINTRWPTALFPWATLWVNISGAFLLGLLVSVLAERTALPSATRLLLVSGFLAAYTTFSTLNYESLVLIESGQGLKAVLNLLGSLVAGMLAVWLGTQLGKLL